jgi:hypothetical protein
MRLRIISVCVKKYQQAFLTPLPGSSCFISLNLVCPRICIFSFYKKHKKNIFTMKTTPIQHWSASKGEFHEPPLPPKPTFSSGYELHPGLIAMGTTLLRAL